MLPILEAKGLKKSYNDGKDNVINVIKDGEFSIFRGEKIAILGDSGCGKSTLINMLGLLLNPDSGEILINNKNVLNLSSKEKAILRNEFFGYIVQDYALIEEDTAYQNVEVPMLYSRNKVNKNIRKKYIFDSLKRVGIFDKLNEKVKNLSGGQRQRVAIARAIVNMPDIILADEPTGALDPSTSKIVFSLLDSLVSEGKSLIIVTHNKSLAQNCDKEFSIENGCLKMIR